MTTTVQPGDTVRCAYRADHQGVVLAEDDPRAWAGSMAFPMSAPDPGAVRAHVAKMRAMFEAAGMTWDDGRVPVLWTTFPEPRVLWDHHLTVIDPEEQTP